MDQTPLSELLGDKPEEAVEAQAAEQAVETPETPEEAPSEPVRDEKGRFTAKETGVDDQGPPPSEQQTVPLAGQLDERRKRQSVEQERDELKVRLEALEKQFQQAQQPKEPPAPPPSVWEDEQGAFRHVGQQAVSEATFLARLDMSEMLASQAHEDFDEMKDRFVKMMEQNPALQQQALQAKHPWEKAYQIARNAATMESLGATDLDTLKAKIREELMAEMQAQTPVPQQGLSLPPSLTGERNVGNRSGPAWTGPKPLSELLG